MKKKILSGKGGWYRKNSLRLQSALMCNNHISKTYHYVYMQYIKYLKNNFKLEKKHVTVVLHNGDNPNSNKKREHVRTYNTPAVSDLTRIRERIKLVFQKIMKS